VALAYHVPTLRNKDAAALEVLSEVLAGGESARLHQQLVYEKRLARDVGAGYDLTSVDPSLFVIYAQPLPGKPVAAVERELQAQIERLQRTPLNEREITKAKNGLAAAFVFGQDSLFYQGMLLGQYEMAGDWRLLDSYLPGVQAVTSDDIMRVASSYFTPRNRTVGILEPLPTTGKRPAPAPAVPPSGMVH